MHTIYKVHIKEQNRVIRVKDLRIIEDTSAKVVSALPDFDGKPTFDGCQRKKAHLPSPTVPKRRTQTKPPLKSQRFPQNQSRLEQEELSSQHQESGKATKLSNPRNTQTLNTHHTYFQTDERWRGRRRKYLSVPCLHWLWRQPYTWHRPRPTISPDNVNSQIELHRFRWFLFSIQLDVEEPETYERAMSGPHAQQWALVGGT